ncbi:uncharacterized protein LOC134214314 [Armigeres subalbatus]|uniref:uncharacterized protein LOC134214314 n=1 Tax=Armigeres subalbatus TaxID=124917 RepID=UPI002ED04A37
MDLFAIMMKLAAACLLVCAVTALPTTNTVQDQPITENAVHQRIAREVPFRPLFVYRQEELEHLHYLRHLQLQQQQQPTHIQHHVIVYPNGYVQHQYVQQYYPWLVGR